MSAWRMNSAVVAVVVALTTGFVLGLLVPGSRDLEQRQASLAEEVAGIQADQQKIGNVGDVYASILQMDAAMQDFRKRLPAERQFGEFLNELSENLKKSDIHDYVVQPKQSREVDEKRLPEALKSAKGMTILPVGVSFHASSAQVFEFLKEMEFLPRLSHVDLLKLVNDEARPGQVAVEMVLHTYYHPEAAAG